MKRTRIQTPIIYVPRVTPGPPSIARRRAYRDNSPLPGPASDPDGWFTLPPNVIHGKLCNERHVQVECSVSRAI
jgi:hypothetical protein